jgi:uncharacterized protein
MINVRCPICSKAFQINTIDDLPSFPFCTERCKLIDLGRWIDGKYAIPETPPGEKASNGETGGASPPPEEEDADS